MSENSNLADPDTSGIQFGLFTNTPGAMMSITDLFLMIIHEEIILDKPSCEGIIHCTAQNMKLQKVSFFCFSHETYYQTPVLQNLSLSDH